MGRFVLRVSYADDSPSLVESHQRCFAMHAVAISAHRRAIHVHGDRHDIARTRGVPAGQHGPIDNPDPLMPHRYRPAATGVTCREMLALDGDPAPRVESSEIGQSRGTPPRISHDAGRRVPQYQPAGENERAPVSYLVANHG